MNFYEVIGKMPRHHALLGHPTVKRSNFDTENKPCVALLGVNSMIRDEAACILVGRNVWGLCLRSLRSHVQDDSYRFWETYAQYFSYVVVTFDPQAFDEKRFTDISKRDMRHLLEDREDSDHFDQTRNANIHREQLSLMMDALIAQRNVLLQMNLKSLLFDFWNLCWFNKFCSDKAPQHYLECLEMVGPWYRLDQKQDKNLKTKPETKIIIMGPIYEKERDLLWGTWGLKVASDMDMTWL